MWHEVCVERTPQVFAKFDASRGLTLDVYFVRIMLWYAYKHVAGHGREKHRKRLSRPLPDYPDRAQDLSVEEERSWTDLLEPLAKEYGEQGELDAWIIMHVAVYGYSFTELTGALQETPGQVGKMYRDAIERARTLLGRELDE